MNLNSELHLNKKLLKSFIYLFWLIVLMLFIAASKKYAGQWHIYALFTVTANLLLVLGFRKNAIFFDTFIGIFFWLGFWLKFTDRVAFSEAVFSLAGQFDGSAYAFDKGLLVASCGLFGLILASFVRERFWFNYSSSAEEDFQHKALFKFYQKNKKAIWLIFLGLIIVVGFSNLYVGIYQRGTLPRVHLPFGLNGIFTWLLMFGLASISATIIRLEMLLKNNGHIGTTISIGLLENFISNTSMLSRGMLLQSIGLIYGAMSAIKNKRMSVKLKSITVPLIFFIILFASSVAFVNYYRLWFYQSPSIEELESIEEDEVGKSSKDKGTKISKDDYKLMTTSLLLGRWIGIEEVLAVSSYPKLGWSVWNEAWKEKLTAQNEKTHFYNRVFTKSPSVKIDRKRFHFIETLPGVVAFFYYPSSVCFLFFGLFSLGLFAAFLEYFAYIFSGKNLILSALFAQVIAFRYMNFGYTPAQSYLLIGALLANAILIYLINFLLSLYYKKIN